MHRLLAAAFGAALTATPALAQDVSTATETPLPDPNGQGDSFQIGLGAAFVPDYEGSNNYRIVPGGIIRARVGGLSVFSRGTYLYADLIPGGGRGIDVDAGPIAGVRVNRTGKVKDDAVDALGDRKPGIEVGGFAGVTFKGLTNAYDALSIRLDAVKDVGNAHEGWVLTPTIEFGTPLSRTTYAGLALSADFVSERYADYYFGVDAAGSARSGLPVTDFSDGGLKNWQAGLLLAHSLSGDLRKGWGLFGSGSYKRLVGDIADSPIVADRGRRGQWFAAAGVGYSW
jgi:outer membrane scaffolding protein for murein synthesis (MipA/OmpV family)